MMSFTLGTTLFRYIRKEYKKDNRGVFVEAFVEERGEPLSVNSIGIESKRDVARHYANSFETGKPNRVAISFAKLSKYNKAGEKAGVIIRYPSASREWTCLDNKGNTCAAYTLTNHKKSPSHSHVQFVRYLSEINAKRFARAMAKTGFVMVRI